MLKELKDMETPDRVAMILFAVMMLVGGGWWFGKVIPERDAKLFAIHDCFQEKSNAVNEYGDPVGECWGVPGKHQSATDCWAECTETLASEAVASNRSR